MAKTKKTKLRKFKTIEKIFFNNKEVLGLRKFDDLKKVDKLEKIVKLCNKSKGAVQKNLERMRNPHIYEKIVGKCEK